MKIVEMGRCATCGQDLHGCVDWMDFIEFPTGRDLSQVLVEAHCGIGGHNMYSRWVGRDEYAELPDYTPTTSDYYHD